MLATTRNLDILCLQLRNLYPLNDDPLRKELDKLLTDIEYGITTGEDIKPLVDNTISKIFNIRIKGIKWLFEQQKIDFNSMYDDIYLQFEELRSDSRLEILAENLLFAIRTNKRVIDALISTGDFSQATIEQHAPSLPVLTYNQFITAIAMGIADDNITQKIIEWTNSSLYIEFVAVAAFIIKDEKLKVSKRIINQLAFLVANAAQDYSAIATEIGIIKLRSSKQSTFQFTFDNDFIDEQKKFADLDLEYFATNLID
jgi:hypothetical protein